MNDPFATLRELSGEALSALQGGLDAMIRLRDGLAAATLPEPPVRIVECDATGQTIVNAQIQAAIDGANGVPVFIPSGRYLIDAAKPVQLRSGLTLLLSPDAVFVVDPNALTHYDVIEGDNVSDVVVTGGQVAGDRVRHNYVDTGNAQRTHEWGMGVRLRDCKRVTIRGMRVRECTGDGFTVSGQDIYLVDCVSLYNRRQGLSTYDGKNIRVIRGEYAFTGQAVPGDPTGATGAKPMTGIDVEPDSGAAEDVVIEGAYIHDNRSSGVLAVSRSGTGVRIGLTVRNCRFARNTNPIEASGTGGPVHVEAVGNTMEQHSGAFGAKAFTGATIAFDGNTVSAKSPRTPSATPGPYDLLSRAIDPGPLGVFVVGTTNQFK